MTFSDVSQGSSQGRAQEVGRVMRRRTRRGSLLGALSAMAMLMGGAAHSETLADALVSAYRQSHLLEQNQAVLRAADEDVATAVATLRPVVAFAASHGYAKTLSTSGNSSSIGLTASLTLFDSGQNRLGVDIARETVMATREALVSVEQSVLLSAVSAFFQMRSALESVAINQNSVKVIGEELRAAQDRFEVGEVTRTDVAQAEASLAAARASLAAADGDLQVAREAYKAAVGHYPDDLARAPAAPALPGGVEEAKNIAVRSNPALKEAQRQVTVSELQVALARAQGGPSLGLSASSSLDQDEQNTYSVGVDFSQPIYSGGSRSALQRQAIAGRDQARAALLQSGVTVEQDVGEAWSAIEVARVQIRATDEQIRAAQVAYDGVREEAALGARTTLDVLDAEQDLLDAQASRITAEANLQISYYSLLSSMGLLTVEHLKLGIPTYDPEAYYSAVKSAPVTSSRGESLDRVLRAIGKK